MSSSRKQWLLKVIAGPHQGAEIGLYAGKTLVGSDDECDVVLHDILVAPQHLELELTDSGITAAPLGGRVYANGKRIRDARQPVADFGFLSIGGTHLVVGPAEGKWPLLSAADVPELEKEAEPAAEAQAKEGEEPAQENAGAGSQEGPKPVVAQPAAPLAAAPSPQGSKAGPILGIAAGLLLLLGWAAVYTGLSGGGGKSDVVEETPAERARAVVEEMGAVGSIQVEESAGGRVLVSGYVDTESRQRELQTAFREAVPGTRIKIYSLEKIASTARSLIDLRQLPLTVSSLSEGKLKIAGKLPSADPWILMRQSLLREVPGISGIEDSVEIEAPRPGTPNTVFVPVPGMVSSGGSATSYERPAAAPTPASTQGQGQAGPGGAAPAPASLPAGQTTASVPTAAAAAAGPGAEQAGVPQPDPVTDYLVTADTIDTPEATVASITPSQDGLAFVRLSTGGVYFVGARLPFGGTVAKIDAETVTVVEKGVSRTLRQGDAAMKAKTTSATSAP